MSYSPAGLKSKIGLSILAGLVLLIVPACQTAAQSARMAGNAHAAQASSADQSAALIGRLNAARQADLNQAQRAGTSAPVWEDCMVQANKARKASEELAQGIEVPQAELEDALFVPSATLSSAERQRLAAELRRAIRNDQQREEDLKIGSDMSNFPYPTAAMASLEDHKQLAQRVLTDIETGTYVRRITLQRALGSPED